MENTMPGFTFQDGPERRLKHENLKASARQFSSGFSNGETMRSTING